MIDLADAEDVVRAGAPAPGPESAKPGANASYPVSLDEPERHVAERRRDLDGAVAASARVDVVDGIAQKRAAALVEERHRSVEVLHAKAQAHHAGRVPAEIARGLRPGPGGRRDADAHGPRAEDHRLLVAPRGELVARPRDLVEVELLVEVPGALDVFDDEVERVVSDEADAAAHHG